MTPLTITLYGVGGLMLAGAFWYGLEWLFERWEQRRINDGRVEAELPY